MRKKLYIAIFLLVIIIVAVVALVLSTGNSPVQIVRSSLKPPQLTEDKSTAGDTFTYNIKGISSVTDINSVNSVIQQDFSQYNKTEFYRISITAVNGSEVSFNTTWRFTNGTEILGEQKIDLATGIKSDENGFYAVYAANLTKNDKMRPNGLDKTTVNDTETRTYKDSVRETNVLSLQNQFTNLNDPTGSTQRFDTIYIYFDKQTGVLVEFRNVQMYNNPEMTLSIEWKLTDSNIWAVS